MENVINYRYPNRVLQASDTERMLEITNGNPIRICITDTSAGPELK